MVSDWTYHGDTEYINLAKDEQNRRLKEITPKVLYETDMLYPTLMEQIMVDRMFKPRCKTHDLGTSINLPIRRITMFNKIKEALSELKSNH